MTDTLVVRNDDWYADFVYFDDYGEDEDWCLPDCEICGGEFWDGGTSCTCGLCVDCRGDATDVCILCGGDMCPQCYEGGCGFCKECLSSSDFAEQTAEVYAVGGLS